MACCTGVEIDEEAFDKNDKIQHEIEREKKKKKDEFRILLLGTGDSGKTTIVKQMKILHQGGFSEEERRSFLPLIQKGIITSMQTMIEACHNFDVHIKKKVNRDFAKNVICASETPKYTEELVKGLTELWHDGGIRNIFRRRNEYQLSDSTQYFLDNAASYVDPHYLPVDQDLLRYRASTTGIVQTVLCIGDKNFVIIDVGGQRSERKKWIHCFEDVSCVLFVVGTSEFDQVLFEDSKTNRLVESRKIFHEICRSKWFSSAITILFLNKIDLLAEKLSAGKSIKTAFEEYEGPNDFESSLNYIRKTYESVRDPLTGEVRQIYTHSTCATDTNNFKVVWNAVHLSILNTNLKAAGIM